MNSTGMHKGPKLRFTAVMNKERSKVLFAEVDSHFADILLSFLTLPLGRILKIFENHYGDKAPKIGSLNNLYRSLASMDSPLFVKEYSTKFDLLDGRSSFEDEYRRLKLDIANSRYPNCFFCRKDSGGGIAYCGTCLRNGGSKLRQDDGIFSIKGTPFVISDDLQILPSDSGLSRIMGCFGITNMDEAEQTLVEFGLTEIVSLLKASLTSSTPLTDVILNRASSANILESSQQSYEESPTSSRIVYLKVTRQRSTGNFLLAQADEDFMEFLFGFFAFPLGRAARLFEGKGYFKAINSLNRSAAESIDDKYFKEGMKMRLTKLDFPKESILPITREPLFSRQMSCRLMDDLTVVPFSITSMLTSLKEQDVAVSDAEEVELQIGLKEGFRILTASLTSPRVLTDALIDHMSNKRVKRESSY